jgi:hypothetical protein
MSVAPRDDSADEAALIKNRWLAHEQLRRQFRAATEKTRQLMEVWRRGQPAAELVEELVRSGEFLRDMLIREGGSLPEEIRAEALELIECLGAAIRCGEEWMATVGRAQVAEAVWRERLGKTYGVGAL